MRKIKKKIHRLSLTNPYDMCDLSLILWLPLLKKCNQLKHYLITLNYQQSATTFPHLLLKEGRIQKLSKMTLNVAHVYPTIKL